MFKPKIPEFVSTLGNTDRKNGLGFLQRLRNRGGAQHQDFGAVELSIPELDFYVITSRYPDLMSPDAEISTKAWNKFIRSSESAIYRTKSTNGKATSRLAK
jgi:hypothetical protein